MKRNTFLSSLLVLAVGLMALAARGDTTRRWDFTTKASYEVSDPAKIEVDPTAPGYAQLVLQPQEIYRTTLSNYLESPLVSGLVFGHSGGLKLVGQNQKYEYPAVFISRPFDKGVAGGWQVLKSNVENSIFDTQSQQGEIPIDSQGLVALCHFDNTYREEISQKNLTPVGNVVFRTARIGTAALQTWQAACGPINVLNGAGGATIATWVYIRESAEWGGVVFSQGTYSTGLEQSPNGSVRWYVQNSKGFDRLYTPVLERSRWYWVVGTWSGASGAMAIYLNGERIGVLNSSPVVGNLELSAPFVIGAKSMALASTTRLQTDELAIWDRALSDGEVQDFYASLSAVKFWVRSGSSESLTGSFVGPDGTAGTYYLPGVRRLISAGNFNEFQRFAQYKVEISSDVNGSGSPFISSVTMVTADGVARYDDTSVDFRLGTPDAKTRIVPDQSSTPHLGLSKGYNGGYEKDGLFTSAVLDGGSVDAFWQNISWQTPDELNKNVEGLVGLWHMNGDWSPAAGSVFGSPVDASFSAFAKLGSGSAVFNGTSSEVSLALNSKISTLMFWVRDEQVNDALMSLVVAVTNTVNVTITNRQIAVEGMPLTDFSVWVNGSDVQPQLRDGWNHVAILFKEGLSVGAVTLGVAEGDHMQGQLDEMAVLSRLITQTEVTVHIAAALRHAAGRVRAQVRTGNALPLTGVFSGAGGDPLSYYANGASLNIAGRRYLQYRLRMEGDGTSTPVAERVTLVGSGGSFVLDSAAAYAVGDADAATVWYGDETKKPDLRAPGALNLDVSGDAAAEGLWHMDEETWGGGGATVLDSKGTRHGTPAGDARPTKSGAKVGLLCGDFDGNGDFVSLPSVSLPSDFSVALWFNSSATAQAPLISTRDADAFFELALNSDSALIGDIGKVVFVVNDGNQSVRLVSRRGGLNDGHWHHVVGVRDGNQIHIFIDGLREGTVNTGTVGSVGSGAAYIGKAGLQAAYLTGKIDEVGIWSRSLSDGEIGDLVAAGGEAKSGGVYESDVLDAEGPSIWEALFWTTDGTYGKALTVQDSSLVAVWAFSEPVNSVTVLDDVTGRQGSLNGAAALGQTGRFGNGLRLNSGGYISVGHNAVLESSLITVEAWVDLDSVSDRQIITKFGAGNGYRLGVNAAGYPYFEVGGQRATASMVLRSGKWMHVAGSYDGARICVYVNGMLENSLDSIGAVTQSGQPLLVGGNGQLNGLIDQVAIHNRALSSSEMWDHYSAGAGTLKFQIRASDSPLMDSVQFVGPGGSTGSYFVDSRGSDMVGIFPLARYFQFRAVFDTEDFRVNPPLYGAKVFYSKYPVDTPWVQPTAGQALSFPGKLISFNHNRTFSDNTDVKYQISGDVGVSNRWFYWDASSGKWAQEDAQAGDAFLFQSSTRDEINDNIGSFYQQYYDKVGGGFRFKARLKSDGAEQVKVDWVEVKASEGRITVNFPNGNEVDERALVVGVPYDITWSSTGKVSQSLAIELWDVDQDGNLFQARTIAPNVPNTGRYNAVISDNQGTNYFIRIRDTLDATVEDWSDGPFWMIGGMRITQPNGAEKWYIGTNNLVQWQSPSFPDLGTPAMLWISYDGGTVWNEITPAAQRPPNAVGLNEFIWATPSNRSEFISETAKMGVSPLGSVNPLPQPPQPYFADISDEVFTLAGLSVDFPTTGDAVRMSDEVPITWTGAGVGPAGVKIEFFDGVSWRTVATSAPHTNRVSQFLSMLTATAPTEAAKVKITSNTDPRVWGISDTFVLADINILAPLGGGAAVRSKWQIGTTNIVKWTAGGAGNAVDIEYTIDNGATWLPIAMGYANVNSGAGVIITNSSPPWVITGPPSATAKVRVRSVAIPSLAMITRDFSIQGVQVVRPNGGEVWEFVNQNRIDWLFEEAGGTLAVDISFDGGGSYEVLKPLVGIFGGGVDVPAAEVRRPANAARIKLRATGAPPTLLPVQDISDASFTIRGMKMTAPTNGVVYTMGKTAAKGLKWYSAATEDTTAQILYAPNGVDFNTVIRFGPNDFIGNADSGDGYNEQDWSVARSLTPSATARVKVLTESPAGTFSSVSAPFTLRGIRVTKPARAELFDIGAPVQVRWAAAGLDPAALARPELSTKGQSGAYANAALPSLVNVSDLAFDWTIDPEVDPSTNAVLRFSVASPAADTDLVMYSDPFTLRGLKVLSPGTGTNWVLGQPVTVSFLSAGMGNAAADIYYSSDGVTYDLDNPIATGVALKDGVNTFAWTIEASSALTRMPSTTAFVKVVTDGYEGVSKTFRLSGIKVTRPTAKDVWAVSDVTNTIRWVGIDAPATFNLSFTVWDGATPTLTRMIDTGKPGFSYNWFMSPEAIGREVTIQVFGGSYTGISERFEMVGVSSIRLLTPTEGAFWKASEAKDITWIRGGTMPNDFAVTYSTEPYTVTNTLAEGAFDLQDSIFTYTWDPIPKELGRTRITVQHRTIPSIRAQLDDFTIAPKFEIRPFPGRLYAQEPASVDWVTRGDVEQGIDLYYSIDPGRGTSSWQLVTSDGPLLSVANDQPSTYLWTVPNPIGVPVKAWLRVQDHAYANRRFPAGVPGPYDDLGMFDINFYTITWRVIDRVTQQDLNGLSVTDSSGWSEAGLTSPVIHQYPFGAWDTVWFRRYFNNLVVFNWNSKPSRTITQYMDRSEIDPDYQVLSDFQFDSISFKFLIQSWLERGGEILPTPDRCTITVYDKAGNVVVKLSDAANGLVRLDANGVFWHEWLVPDDLPRNEIYFAKVEIIYAGAPYTAGVTYTLHLPADQAVAETILAALLRTESNIVNDIGGEISGLRDDTTAGFSNLTEIASQTQEDMKSVVSNVNDMAETFNESMDILTNQVSIIGPAVSNMVGAVSNLQVDVISGLASILTRPTAVLYGSTNTFLYKTRSGFDAGLVKLSIPDVGYTANMTEIVGGIYETTFVADWGTNSYLLTCSDPNAQDSMMLNVVGAEQLATSEMMKSVEQQLTGLETDIAQVAGMVEGIGGTDLSGIMGELDALSSQVLDVQNAVAPLESIDGAALARIEAKLGSLDSTDPESFFGRLNALESQLNQIGADSSLAVQKANSAKTAAGNASSAAMGIQKMIEDGELVEAAAMLKEMRTRLQAAQQGVEEIPSLLGTGQLFSSVEEIAMRMNEFASSKGYKNLLKLESPLLGAGEGAGGTGVSKDVLDALVRDMQEMRSTMQFMQKLMDEMRYEPVVEETLFGVQ